MINWAYVAGFFDGEGSAWVGSKSFRVSIVQVYKPVLDGIQEFLATNGIMAYVRLFPRYGNALAKQTAWTLTISKRESVVCFLRAIFPFLQVKKTVAQDIIRYSVVYPKLGGHGCILNRAM